MQFFYCLLTFFLGVLAPFIFISNFLIMFKVSNLKSLNTFPMKYREKSILSFNASNPRIIVFYFIHFAQNFLENVLICPNSFIINII